MPAPHNPPYPADQVADARRLVANLHDYLHLHPADLAEALGTAWAILRADRAHRLATRQPTTFHAFPEDAA